MMEITYGQGQWFEKNSCFKGQIILSEHKLFLKEGNQDLPQTYVPLEKIEAVKIKGSTASFFVRQSLHFDYTTHFQGEREKIVMLVKEIVSRRGLKKKFLKQEWVET